jgi:hypothetical protein
MNPSGDNSIRSYSRSEIKNENEPLFNNSVYNGQNQFTQGAEHQRNSFSNTLNTLKVSKLVPIASCETIHISNTSSSSNSSTAVNDEHKTNGDEIKVAKSEPTSSPSINHNSSKKVSYSGSVGNTFDSNNSPNSSMNKRTSGLMIENVLNNVVKANVSDGIINNPPTRGNSDAQNNHKMSVTSMPLGASFLIPNADNKTFSTVTNLENGAQISGDAFDNDDDETDDNKEEDYNSDEDSNMRNKFRQVRKVVHTKESKSTSSLNGSISSAASRLGVNSIN